METTCHVRKQTNGLRGDHTLSPWITRHQDQGTRVQQVLFSEYGRLGEWAVRHHGLTRRQTRTNRRPAFTGQELPQARILQRVALCFLSPRRLFCPSQKAQSRACEQFLRCSIVQLVTLISPGRTVHASFETVTLSGLRFSRATEQITHRYSSRSGCIMAQFGRMQPQKSAKIQGWRIFDS